jgi:protein TonB
MLVGAALLVAAGLIVPLPTLAVDRGNGLVTPIERARPDRPPQVLSATTPAYPARARTEGVEGQVYLDLRVSESGNVDSVRVTRGVENYPEFGEAAMEAAQKWRFTPGERGGVPVTTRVTVPVRFTLAPPAEPTTDPVPPTSAARAAAAGSMPPSPPAPAGMRSPPSMDTAPVLMEHRSPAYPARARNDHIEGVVTLHLRVSAEGVVDSACVSTGVDGYPEFAEAALGAARSWRFTPGSRDGQPVTVWVYCPVRFRLDAALTDMPPTSGAATECA